MARETSSSNLQDRGILSSDSLDVPTFGHETRRDVTVRWGIDKARARTRKEAIQVITGAAELVESTDDPQVVLRVMTILDAYRRAAELSLPTRCQVWYQSCRSLLGETDRDTLDALTAAMEGAALSDQLGSGAPLAAMGLFNTLIYAKSEEDLARRDGLLDELRELAVEHTDDDAVHGWLARSLMVSAFDAYQRGRSDEVRRVVTEVVDIASSGEATEMVVKSLLLASAVLWDLYGQADDDGSRERLLGELEPWGISTDDLAEAVAAIAEAEG